VPGGITTEADLIAWLHQEFPNLSDASISSILAQYPTNYPADGAKFATNGLTPPTATDVSGAAAGQQQRAYNILAEATFVCPAYWLATAFAQPGKSAFVYQYSVPFASHGSDVGAYFGPAAENQGPEFVLAFRRMWGGLINKDNPSVSNSVANGASAPDPAAANPASAWPAWTPEGTGARHVVLNETGGTPYQATTMFGAVVTQHRNPGLRNAISAAGVDTWEGGRGKRCEFWRELSPQVPQ
jgi:hypothetical protein